MVSTYCSLAIRNELKYLITSGKIVNEVIKIENVGLHISRKRRILEKAQ